MSFGKISVRDAVGLLRYQYQRLRQYPHYRRELKKIEVRRQGQTEPQFARLKELENSGKGRCFLVADSTALTSEQIHQLRNETVFGAVSAAQADCWKKCRATYLGIQDPRACSKLEQDFDGIIFAGDNLTEQIGQMKQVVLFPYLGVYKYYINRYREYNTKFSKNAAEVVYDGYSVVYSLLQLAVYMGFTEICLIGCDCFHSENEKLTAAYRVAKQYADAHNIRIINGTPGESDSVFPYCDLHKLLSL